MENALFRHDSAVFLPNRAEVKEKAKEAQEAITELQVLSALYKHPEYNPHDCLLIAGHTVASGPVEYNFKLSELRALSALYLLEENKDEWTKIADDKQPLVKASWIKAIMACAMPLRI